MQRSRRTWLVGSILLVGCSGLATPEPAPDTRAPASLQSGPSGLADAAAPEPPSPALRADAATTAEPDGTAGATDAQPDVGSVDGAHRLPAVEAVPRVYATCESGAIYRYDLDSSSGTLSERARVMGVSGAWLAIVDGAGQHLYTANLGAGTVAGYAIDLPSGNLIYENTVLVGADPAYVSLSGSGRHLFVANYGDGSASVLGINANGRIGAVLGTYSSGTNTHSIQADPSGRFVFGPNLGADSVSQFLFATDTGKLLANSIPRVTTATGSGPRHMAFHPQLPYAYVINEHSNSVIAFTLNLSNGTLTAQQTLSTLPPDFDPSIKSYASDIHVHPSGHFVYGSNRGHDSIVAYRVDESTGKLTLIGHQTTGGNFPQVFAIDSSGILLLAANRNSKEIASFRIDERTGTLSPLARVTSDSPVNWVGFAPSRAK